MDTTKIQIIFPLVSIFIFLAVTANPGAVIRLLGRGRVVPPNRALIILRILGFVCLAAAIFRIYDLVVR